MSRVVNLHDVPAVEIASEGFSARRRKLAAAAGGRMLGCSAYDVPPGARAFPRHFHHGNEEAIFVLSGEGTLLLGGGSHPLRAGDYVALPAGPEHAHQVVNTGDDVLSYLCLSTMRVPDVTEYPDSDKLGVFTGAAPGGEGERPLSGFWRRADAVGYLDGEGGDGSA